VGNFPFECTQDEVLKVIGTSHDRVVSVRAMTDRTKTKVRGLFVEFPTEEALREVLKYDGAHCGDRPLRVNVAEDRERMGSGSDRRGGSMDRGRRESSSRSRQQHGPRVEELGILQPAAERKKLVLKPRSVETDVDVGEARVNSSSIFGSAKPVDTTKVLEQVERKIDAELHREHKIPVPKKKEPHNHPIVSPKQPSLKIHEEIVTKVEDANVFSLLSIEEDC
jgi:translation initiation factor 4B